MIAAISGLFVVRPIFVNGLLDLQLNTKKNSKNITVVRAAVLALSIPFGSSVRKIAPVIRKARIPAAIMNG